MDVVMPAKKAGQRVRNPRNASHSIKNYGATANAMSGRIFGDSRVVDLMAQKRASD